MTCESAENHPANKWGVSKGSVVALNHCDFFPIALVQVDKNIYIT
jgi:hypothetical protein